MKILMLTDVFFPDTIGGAGRMAYYLSLGLSARGHEIHVLTRGKSSAGLPAYQKLNSSFYIHRFPVPAQTSLALPFYELMNSSILAYQLSRLIDFDLVCTHQTLAALGPLLLHSLASKPVMHCFYSPWHAEFIVKKFGHRKKLSAQDRLMAALLRWLEKRHIRRSRQVMVLSRYSLNQVKNLHQYPVKKITLIPGCVDSDHFQLPPNGKAAVKSDLNLPLNKKIFLTIRNLVPRMGLENLIRPFVESEILRKQGLLLIGGKGFLEAQLKSMVAEHHLQACIKFLGYVPEEKLPCYYQAADFFILPTEKLEGFGLVILEALACGTPVMGTPVGAIPEILVPFAKQLVLGGHGSRFIKKGLEDTITRPDQFTFTPQACRAYVQERYHSAYMIAAFEKLAHSIEKH